MNVLLFFKQIFSYILIIFFKLNSVSGLLQNITKPRIEYVKWKIENCSYGIHAHIQYDCQIYKEEIKYSDEFQIS